MAEVQAPVAEPVSATPPKPKRNNERRRKIKKFFSSLITLLVVLAMIGGAAYAVWYFVFQEKEEAMGEPIFDEAWIGSIVQTASISGSANAKDSASITLTQSGVVEALYVYEGQMVNEGDPLYVVTSPSAEQALLAAQEAYQTQVDNMAKLRDEMNVLYQSRGDLTVTAPHAGKLTEVQDIKVGDPLGAGFTIARIVDDTKLKLSLYYSYAYEEDIYVGKPVTVSVPVVMASLTGTVEKINKVRMIAPEGGVNFEVVIVVDNPGTMTEGMAATASMTDDEGFPIYPYADSSFTYYQITTVATKAAGPVDQLADLMNYADVVAGQVLLIQGTNNVDELIRLKQEQIDLAQEALNEAWTRVKNEEQNLLNFSATAPISGLITALPIYEGMEVNAGTTSVIISNNSIMTVNIQVDDRNRQYINVGDEIQLNDWYGNYYIGVVDSIAVIGDNMNGVTVYPGVVRIDNSMGTLMGGYWLNGQITAASSFDCVVVPRSDIRSYSPEGSLESQFVVYIQTDEEREEAIDISTLPEAMQAEIPEGCIVVPVEIGLTDTYNAEILSGVQAGDRIFNSTPKTDGSGYWG